jgi:type IV pilus assembly protein PilA
MANSIWGGKERGFTLIELMIVVVIVAVLGALALYGVRQYLKHAKTVEVRSSLGQMAKDAVAAYAREGMKGDVMTGGGSSKAMHNLCTDAAHKVPADIESVRGKKYQSSPSDWMAGNSATAGFVCLRFAVSDPQYYQYDYKGTAGEAGAFEALAYGDLDGDLIQSTFSLAGRVSNGVVFVSPNFKEVDPEE